MHSNFFFLRQITRSLRSKLIGSVTSEVFSQNKDELILRFEMGPESFYIRASLTPELSCLSFPSSFQRARKNSVDLFPDIIGRKVAGIVQFNNERSFSIQLSDGMAILFKMHANRANIAMVSGEQVLEIFRKNLPGDLQLDINSLHREIDWSPEAFRAQREKLRALYITFGKVVWRYLEEKGLNNKGDADAWRLISETLAHLNDPVYYITFIDDKPALSLLETGEVKKIASDPLEAANEFFYSFNQEYAYAKEKNVLLAALKARLESAKNYCARNSQKLDEVLLDNRYKIWADVVMANLHAIATGAEKVTLANFYDDQRPIEIKLKKDLTPQKNAELFYRKAKNQHIEITRLERSIREKQAEVDEILKQIVEIEHASDLKALRSLAKVVEKGDDVKARGPLPYHEFLFRDYRIWVGKNAQANDVLTFKHGYKEDLWLHAKDVSGSHVLIKYQSGKNFPGEVIEYAASLAAYNSKRKNDTLCPVIVTPRKFVRKRKGDPAGAVIVEREDVVLVEPKRS